MPFFQDCDVLVSASMTTSRFKWLDFTHPSTYLFVGYIIPKAEPAISLTSIIKPFSNEVGYISDRVLHKSISLKHN